MSLPSAIPRQCGALRVAYGHLTRTRTRHTHTYTHTQLQREPPVCMHDLIRDGVPALALPKPKNLNPKR